MVGARQAATGTFAGAGRAFSVIASAMLAVAARRGMLDAKEVHKVRWVELQVVLDEGEGGPGFQEAQATVRSPGQNGHNLPVA